MKKDIRVGFICVHNSCRSQMAEALGKMYASDTFSSFSAGTQLVDKINPDAVVTIKELYSFDMSDYKSKLIDDITPLDIVITMGCNVNCPYTPSKHREDWGLEDPTGKEKEEFIKTAKTIKEKVENLKKRIENGEIPL